MADVYLGYPASPSLRPTTVAPRREAVPATGAPPAGIRPRPGRPSSNKLLLRQSWERTWDDESYAEAIEAVRAAIARGDVYQVNLVQHLSAPFEGDPAGLAQALAPLRPLGGDGWAIVSASPELFLAPRRPAGDDADQGHAPAGEDVEGPRRTPPST